MEFCYEKYSCKFMDSVWPESLFIDTDSDFDEISGFNTDPIKANSTELHLNTKSITKNQYIFEEACHRGMSTKLQMIS